MLNQDAMRSSLMNEIQKIIAESQRKYTEEINLRFLELLPAISEDLWNVVENLHVKYKAMEDSGTVGELKWIYFSFLRTSFVDDSLCYRIDFYDETDCISDVECAGYWGFDYIYHYYFNIKKQVMDTWHKQTQVKTYEADLMLHHLAEHFRSLSDLRIPQLIHYLCKEHKEIYTYGDHVKILLGDFLDQANIVAEIRLEEMQNG